MFSSDPLSHGLAGDGHDSMNYGMIATGNHQYSNSLRGAPPLVSKGSLRAARGRPVPSSVSRLRETREPPIHYGMIGHWQSLLF